MIYSFDAQREQFVTIDNIPDFRTEVEKKLTPISIYNHGKPDIAYAERMAEEIINISGAWVTVFLKESKGDTDDGEIWDEDADPLYRASKKMKAYFKPEPSLIELTRWGIDIPIRITAVFSRAALMKEPGIGKRLLLPGDVIEAPYNLPTSLDIGPMRFRVLNSKQEGNFQYRWLYVSVLCELLTGDDALKVRTEGPHS
ncbi:MAG: hypothetical protein QXU32_00600 [Nitrososphaerales archaeon]